MSEIARVVEKATRLTLSGLTAPKQRLTAKHQRARSTLRGRRQLKCLEGQRNTLAAANAKRDDAFSKLFSPHRMQKPRA